MTNLEALKHFITEELYIVPGKDPATTAPAAVEKEVQEQVPKVNVKGNPSAKVLIAFHDDDNEHLVTGNEQFLHKILQAVHVEPGDTALVNTAQEGVNEDFILTCNASKILIFNLDQAIMNTPVTVYTPTAHQGKTFLISDRLDELQKDQNKTRLLWKSLQEMFLGQS